MESYVGMDRKYFVGYQHVFKYDAADILEYENSINGKHLRALSLELALPLTQSSIAKRITL